MIGRRRDPSARGRARLPRLVVGAAIVSWLASCTETPTIAEATPPPVVPSEAPSPPPTTPTMPSSPSTSTSAPTPAPPEPARTNARVVRVVDGDTIEASFRGRVIDIRLIGVDTPETVHPSEPVECFGIAASRFTTRHLEGERVRLTFDVERLDPFDRTLAYVWLGGRLFNERLVREGYATVSTFPPNVRYVERFLAAQRVARNDERGLWGGCEQQGSGSPAPVVGGGGGGGGACDPSYPDVCIPPSPPDLDCADVSHSRFRVVGSDPHGFDGDGDGVGCES